MNLTCLMDLILFLILKTTLNISSKKKKKEENCPPVQIYVNKIKNRIIFKIKREYKLELLTEKTVQLLGSSKKDNDQNKDGEIVPRLEIVEVVLVQGNLVNNNYQHASKVLFNFVPNKELAQLITITLHSPTMLKTIFNRIFIH